MKNFCAMLAIALGVVAGSGCPSNDCSQTGTTGGATGGSAQLGGPVLGIVDNHCWAPGAPDGGLTFQAQAVQASSCYVVDGGLAYDEDAGAGVDGGSAYGPTQWNASSNDDDCKYVVTWSATPIAQQKDVTFTVAVVNAADGTPATGAYTYAEVFLPKENHLSPSTNPPVAESSPGLYTIGPVIFDLSGLWTVRFHFYENCLDLLPDSPHGHAAYFVNVP